MRHLKIFLLSALCISLSASAQGNKALHADSLPLIPYPNHITVGTKDFKAASPVKVVIASRNATDADAFSIFSDDYTSQGINIEKKIGGSLLKNGITITRPGFDKAADKAIKNAGLVLDTTNAESYVLLVDSNRVIVSAKTDAGVFYGIQTLRQLCYKGGGKLNIRAVAIADAPSMKYRWIQDDWSRGPIPNINYIKEQIRTLAEYKLNGYCIYGENIFQSTLYPEINLYGGTVTPAEIKEIVEYARRYHVDIVPQQECFGHMHYTLRQARFADLGERRGGQVLSPAVEGTYTFLQNYLSEIVPNFTSPFVHIGCDEAFELGRGKSAEMVKKTSVDDVFLKHLQRVADLPALNGKKLLFWGEIATKPNVDLTKVPKNAIGVVWDYLPRADYEYFLPPYAKAGIPTFVSPGAFWGGRMFPDYDDNLVNIRNLMRDGKKYHTLGMLNTTWDDVGEDIFDMGWYGILYGACCAWQNEQQSSINAFKKAFDWAFYRNDTGHQFAQAIDSIASVHTGFGQKISFDWAYSVPFEDGGVDLQNLIENSGKMESLRLRCANAFAILAQGRNVANLHQSTIGALMFGARRMEFVFDKAYLATEVSRRYDDYLNDDDKNSEINTAVYDLIMPYASKMGSLRDMSKELESWHHDLWLHENRPFHWEIVQAHYDYLQQEWNKENALLGEGFGKRLPREQVGLKFARPAK
jgi:hexosaminidase